MGESKKAQFCECLDLQQQGRKGSVLQNRALGCSIWQNQGVECSRRPRLLRWHGIGLDCPGAGPGQVQGIFCGPDPGPAGPVQLATGPEPEPY